MTQLRACALVLFSGAVCLAGCTVGPNYHRPDAPTKKPRTRGGAFEWDIPEFSLAPPLLGERPVRGSFSGTPPTMSPRSSPRIPGQLLKPQY